MNYEDFLQLVKKRRSFRRFKPDPVPKEIVDAVTKRNITQSITSGYKKIREVDPNWYRAVAVQPYLSTAPVLIVVCGDRRLQETYPAHLPREILLHQSLAISIYTLQLAAASFGLATAWATMQTELRETQIRKILGIPDVYTVDHIIPLGYPDEEKEKSEEALRPVRERASFRRELALFIMNNMIWANSDRMKRSRSSSGAKL